ncbi:hypothetical protein RUND412_008245 [Rhizina undulata]
MLHFLSTILALAGSVHIAGATLGKDVWYSDGLSPHLDDGLGNSMAAVSINSVTQWPGTIPQACRDTALQENRCALTNMETFEVKYGDCDSSWFFCRCNTAVATQEELYNTFAKIPVGMRSNVRYIMAFPATAGSAYEYQNDIVFFGDVVDPTRPSVMIHESAHANDKNSYSSTYLQPAVDQDTCVPDDYANTNIVEDFAQVFVVHMYQLSVGSLPKDATCMQNQLNLLNKDFPSSYLYPGKCDLSVKPAIGAFYWNTSKRDVQISPDFNPPKPDAIPVIPRRTPRNLIKKSPGFNPPTPEPVNVVARPGRKN